MARVNFGKVVIKTIEGKDSEVDMHKVLGNQLYMQGSDIEACELGKRIYYGEDDSKQPVAVELSDKECDTVRNAVQNYPYITRTAIIAMLPSKK